MPTNLNVKEPPSSQDRIRGLAEGGTNAVIEISIVIGIVLLGLCLSLLIGPAEVDLGLFLGP